jgi:hypothetical protein
MLKFRELDEIIVQAKADFDDMMADFERFMLGNRLEEGFEEEIGAEEVENELGTGIQGVLGGAETPANPYSNRQAR